MSHLEIHQSIDMRMVQGAEVFTEGKTTGTGEFVAWLAHKDGAASGPIDLLMFADMMPPPVFTLYGAYGWVPTVELTVQVRRKPAPGPILARHITRQITAGVAETDTEIWDVKGDLAAMARQTYKVRMPKARLTSVPYSVATWPPGRRISAKPCIHPSSIISELERPMVRRVGLSWWPHSSSSRWVSALIPGSTKVRSGIH